MSRLKNALIIMTPILFVFISCVGQTAQQTTPVQHTKLGRVIFHTLGGNVPVQVEIADDPLERQRGLMYREQLGTNQGMVFIFPREEVRNFWMHNTLIALDMIFIDAQKRVVGIVENADPRTDTARGVGAASQYVVEVVGGYSRDHRIIAGTKLSFENMPTEVVR